MDLSTRIRALSREGLSRAAIAAVLNISVSELIDFYLDPAEVPAPSAGGGSSGVTLNTAGWDVAVNVDTGDALEHWDTMHHNQLPDSADTWLVHWYASVTLGGASGLKRKSVQLFVVEGEAHWLDYWFGGEAPQRQEVNMGYQNIPANTADDDHQLDQTQQGTIVVPGGWYIVAMSNNASEALAVSYTGVSL